MTLVAVAFPFFVVGLVVASGLNLTDSSVAQEFASGGQVTTAGTGMMPDSFAELVEKLSPTVVNVKVRKVQKTTFHRRRDQGSPFGEFFERFQKDVPLFPRNRRTQGAGSGVIISADGYILTNNHVVEGAKEVIVTLADKQEHKAQIVGRDPKTDLAVLKIKPVNTLPSANMGDSERLRVGDWVVAIGNPFGLSHTVTSGIVSAKGRVIGAGPYDDFIQTDASINPGNSGGPLFNMRGEVVGINTAIIPHGQGIGFAIPVNTAKPLIPQLVNNGRVIRGYLGVSIQAINPDLAKAMKLDDVEGALVSDVVSGGPAEKAGIKRGDVIVSFKNEMVEESHDLPAIVAATPVGKEVTVNVIRDGKEHQMEVEVGELQFKDVLANETDKPAEWKWGLMLRDLSSQMVRQHGLKPDHGVVVVDVKPGSPAEKAGIKRGDLILEINRNSAKSVKEVVEVIAKADEKDPLLVLLRRNQGNFFVAMTK
jgi:serine protease Do